MSSPPPSPPEPQPLPQDCLERIRSPNRVNRWIDGTGEFNNQPISPSHNLPNSPPSWIQYDLDGVVLRTPPIGSRPETTHDVFADAFGQEVARNDAGFTGSNQQPNQETPRASDAMLGQLATHHNLVGQIQRRNEHLLSNIYELSPIANPGDNTRQGLHDGNNRVAAPPNSTALRYDNAYTSNIIGPFPESPYGELQPRGQRAHQMPTASGMMSTMNNYSSQPRYGGLQPPHYRALRADAINAIVNSFPQSPYGASQPLAQRILQADAMNAMINSFPQSPYGASRPPGQRAHRADAINSFPQSPYGASRPPGQRAHRADAMNAIAHQADAMNTMINSFPESPYGASQPPGQRAHQADAINSFPQSPYGTSRPPGQRAHQADAINSFPQSPYGASRPPGQRAHQPPTATGVMNAMTDYPSQARYSSLQPPGQRAHEAPMASGMMNTMNDYSSQARYRGSQPLGLRRHRMATASGMMGALVDHFLQPPSQRAHQIDMTTGMMNPMNNYQGGMHGQAPQNNPVPTHHTDHQNDIFGNNPQYQGVQHNDHMLQDYNTGSTQQAVQSSGDRMSSNDLPGTTPQHVVQESIEHSPHNPQPNAPPEQTYYVDTSDDAFTTPSHTLTTPSQVTNAVLDAQDSEPHTPSGYASASDLRPPGPGPVGTASSVSNVPGQMSSNQHIPQNGQGFNVAGIPDNMQSNQHMYNNAQGFNIPNIPGDTLSSQYGVSNNQGLAVPDAPGDMSSDLYDASSDGGSTLRNQHIAHNDQDLNVVNAPDNMAQSEHIDRSDQGDMPTSGGDRMDTSEDRISFDAPQPFNAINPGPFYSQDTSSRQPLQLDSNPTTASNVEEMGAAFDSGEAGTRSARIWAPNIPGTPIPSIRQPQMETPQARSPFKHPARNDKSDTRKEPSRDANRVNKFIRHRKPAKTQKLQSAIANNASQLLEESAPQAVEAQNDQENSKSQANEADDESETSVEPVD